MKRRLALGGLSSWHHSHLDNYPEAADDDRGDAMRVERSQGTGKFGKSVENTQKRFHFLQGLPTRTFAIMLRLHLIKLMGRNVDGGTLEEVAVVLKSGLGVVAQLRDDAGPLW